MFLVYCAPLLLPRRPLGEGLIPLAYTLLIIAERDQPIRRRLNKQGMAAARP